jgi:general secretion pathway protein A
MIFFLKRSSLNLKPFLEFMYLNFYNLRERPFQGTPNPAFLYLSPSHREALATLVYGIEQRKGFVALIGEVGLGKTTLIREFLKQRSGYKEKIIYLFNSSFSFVELLRTLARELDLNIESNESPVLLDHIYQALIREQAVGRQVILLLDEAQLMPEETLEQLRLISNLETPEEKLIQIALIGQPALENKLNRHELRQLNQRIAVKATLAPLSQQDGQEYIKFRIAKAGGEVDSIFTPGALKEIIRLARGVPRVINILCDNALVTGYDNARKPVSAKMVRETARGLRGGKQTYPRRWVWSSLAAVLLVLVVLVGYYQLPNLKRETPRPRLTDLPQTGFNLPPEKVNRPAGPEGGGNKIPADQPETQKIESRETGLKSNEKTGLPPGPSEKGPAADKENPPSTAEGQTSGKGRKAFPQTRMVREGQNLSQLVIEVYGTNKRDLWELVRRHNPQINEDMKIRPGQKLVFPEWKKETAQPGSPSHKAVKAAEEKPLPGAEREISKEAKDSFPQTRIVREGQNLSQLVIEVYGINRMFLWDLVRRHNPEIKEDMKIRPGQKLIFPEWKKEGSNKD